MDAGACGPPVSVSPGASLATLLGPRANLGASGRICVPPSRGTPTPPTTSGLRGGAAPWGKKLPNESRTRSKAVTSNPAGVGRAGAAGERDAPAEARGARPAGTPPSGRAYPFCLREIGEARGKGAAGARFGARSPSRDVAAGGPQVKTPPEKPAPSWAVLVNRATSRGYKRGARGPIRPTCLSLGFSACGKVGPEVPCEEGAHPQPPRRACRFLGSSCSWTAQVSAWPLQAFQFATPFRITARGVDCTTGPGLRQPSGREAQSLSTPRAALI